MAGLHDRPVLIIDPGMHTAAINRAAIDAAGRWAVTGSDDKTVRVWSLADGTLVQTIRLAAGPGNRGKAYAVAMSPDGALIAAGGWTRIDDADEQEQIYLFDRVRGLLVRRIDGLPDVVLHLAFSLDGSRLAAALGSGSGLRVYSREQDWAEIARDVAYDGYSPSYGVAFAPDGRLATTGHDGKVRLYVGNLAGDIRPAISVVTPAGRQPAGIAFSPDGSRLAVGYGDSMAVTLLDGRTLTPLSGPDLRGFFPGTLSSVAWSQDDRTLFAAGGFNLAGICPVLTWSDLSAVLDGSDPSAVVPRGLPAGRDTVMSLVPLPESDLLVAAQDPWLARLQTDGTPRWRHGPPKADFRGQDATPAVSSDGICVDFGFQLFGEVSARFDLASRVLTRDPPSDGRTTGPRREGLPIADWYNGRSPTLSGRPLPLVQGEICRSLAVHPAGDRFVLGTEWHLRAFDSHGTPLWSRPAPGITWAVNVTGDGRLAVAAYADGTIRWHRMSDGAELLALIPLPDQTNWVAWTPEGFYAATAGAHGVLRWHVNRGWDASADSVAVEDIPGLRRPAVLPLVLQELETPRALGLAELVQVRRQVAIRTNSKIPPGARLHLLAIGVSAYNEAYASHLRLRYADRDARDLASAILNTQEGLYAEVVPQVLRNQDANKAGILEALAKVRADMERGTGNDLAVVHFAGHGALVDGKLYLLPHEVDARYPVRIKATALSVEDLRGELLELAKSGRVLVLLDACHSGATTMDGASLPMDSTALRAGLAAANVTVLTSSSGHEASREDPAWQHGAFTKVLLEALTDPAADTDHNGLINANELAQYVAARVGSLTGGAQTPGMEVRFGTTVFACAL